MTFALPIVFIILMWWFSTGAVLWFANQSDTQSRAPLVAMAGVGVLGLIGVYFASFPSTSQAGAALGAAKPYFAVLSALSVWAFIEFTFLTGAITGARKAACPRNVNEKERFWLAFSAINHHEYALVGGLLAVGLVSIPGGQIIAFATYALLWVMRLSAKLTLFSGAPKFALDMMPPKLSHLQSYFRHDRIGPVFWLSTIVFTAAFAAAVIILGSSTLTPHNSAGAIMLTTLLGLGVLEHWFMVLPIADSALWQWAMPGKNSDKIHHKDISNQKGDRHTMLMAAGCSTARQNRRGAPS